MLAERTVFITGMGIVSAIGQDTVAFDSALAGVTPGFSAFDSPYLAVMAQIRDFDLREASVLERIPEETRKQAIRMARRSTPAVQTTVIAALQAWTQANLQDVDGTRIAVLTAGSNLSQGTVFGIYSKAIGAPEFVSPSYAVQQFDTNFNGILSELLGIRGEGMTVGGASASGNVCLIQGMRLLRDGAADVCVCVAPMYDPSPAELSAFVNLQAIGDYSGASDPNEVCRPFDRGHRGFVPGQASVCMVLERAAHACARKQAPLAELAGGAVALDGNHLPDANAGGETRAMRGALENAGVSPGEVDYINAHGTSTPMGDRTEVEAILDMVGSERDRIWVNSTKSLMGHCMFSAGMAEAVATVCQIRGEYVHGTHNLTEPITDQMRLSDRTEQDVRIRCALSNSFGFGGINSSVVIRRTE